MPDHHFDPGSMIAGRFRVVALLGRGGMGDVYRAQDLTLGQDVALKFLPDRLASSEGHLRRFLDEVRMARRVSHPNVCRVHDVGEVDGRHFLSMEYVEGEDLASLLRRVGRLPPDRAATIARQLCAGLGAAHDSGVLHRDLKPANVMIDREGSARIADFGLAAVSANLGDEDIRVGTPEYMAPEQLRGEQVSERSDLFALGLVMHELFTGHPAFEARTYEELLEAHAKRDPDPSSFLPDIDPAAATAIRRCLARDPPDRPASARQVAVSLPGGDPLAAALLAGETPAPELVASAGGRGTLSYPAAWSLLAAFLVSLIFIAIADRRMKLIELTAPELPAPALADRARTMLAKLGLGPDGGDSSYRFVQRIQAPFANAPDTGRAQELLAHPLSQCLRFTYRTSPVTMVPEGSHGRVSWNRPPMEERGMVRLVLGHDGSLQYLEAVPRHSDEGGTPFDWTPAFDAAGLDPERFEEIDTAFLPQQPFDTRTAWRGTRADLPEGEITVLAAALGSRPTLFSVLPEWQLEQRPRTPNRDALDRIFDYSSIAMLALASIGGVWLGWRNLAQRRGDMRGATRVAVYLFVLGMLRWLAQADHVDDIEQEWYLLQGGAGDALWIAMTGWFLYIALEPSVRRLWPHRLVSWNRMLAGRLGDPAVGRDILVGLAGGFLVLALERGNWFVIRSIEGVLPPLHVVDNDFLIGPLFVFGQLAWDQAYAGFQSLMAMFFFVLCIALFRRAWAAWTVLFLLALVAMPWSVMSDTPIVDLLFRTGQAIAILVVLTTGGLVGMFTAIFGLTIVSKTSLSFDFSAWWSGSSLAVAVVVLGLAVYGLVVSTRPVRRTPADRTA